MKGKWFCLPVVFLSAVLFAACTGTGADRQHEEAWYRFTDDLGNEVVLPERPETIVSAYGSYAETWLQAGGNLAGVTDDLYSKRDLQIGPDIPVIGTVKHPNAEAIMALDPDFVILSADIPAQVALSDALTQAAIPHAYFSAEYFEDYLSMLGIFTDITGRADLYRKNGMEVRQRIDRIIAESNRSDEKPTVLVLRCFATGAKVLRPDSMVNAMLADLGADSIVTHDPSLLTDLSMETVMEEDPDFILAVTMGDTREAMQAMHDLYESNPAWSGLDAVKGNRYVFLPKELFHYKPNARWDESYAYLANLLR